MTGFKFLVKHKLVLAVTALMAGVGVFMFVYFPAREQTDMGGSLKDKAIAIAAMAASGAEAGAIGRTSGTVLWVGFKSHSGSRAFTSDS